MLRSLLARLFIRFIIRITISDDLSVMNSHPFALDISRQIQPCSAEPVAISCVNHFAGPAPLFQ